MISEKEAISLLKKHITDENVQEIIIGHCRKVQEIALGMAKDIPGVDIGFIRAASLLHDIGRGGCPPKSKGSIMHGVKGASILREEGKKTGREDEFEAYARVAERHLGAGISRKDITEQELPLPMQDFMPETAEEKIITAADNLVEFRDGKHIMISIGKAVERFTGEVSPQAGQKIKKLHDEVMAMKKK